MIPRRQSVDEMYEHYWDARGTDRFGILDDSLHPRGPSFLLELTETLDLNPSSTILDLGCGRGIYTVELATRYGCRVVAIDPVNRQVQHTERLVAEAGLRERVTVQVGSMESIPLADASVDFIWCGGVLVHIADIDTGLAECSRVLRPRAPG